MPAIPTIKIIDKRLKLGFRIINKSDFDNSLDKKYNPHNKMKAAKSKDEIKESLGAIDKAS